MTSQLTPTVSAPATPATAPPVDEILRYACRAPSVHNTQPWTWRVRGARIDLFADFKRQLMYADPNRRDLFISCGAALHHLQTACTGLGWSARVHRLPDPRDVRHVARVSLTPARPPSGSAELLATIERRRTDRRRLTSWPLPEERLASLSATGSLWGAQVLPVEGELAKARLYALTHRADVVQNRNQRYVAELAAWTLRDTTEGIAPELIPARDDLGLADSLNRRFANGTLEDPRVDPEPSEDALLLVCTSSDDAISWVRAGEALSAVWLEATRENLALVPLSQAVEVDATRHDLYADVLGGLAFPQLLLRLGWLPLSRNELPRTPRRPLEEVVERF
jgi:nitroreductase